MENGKPEAVSEEIKVLKAQVKLLKETLDALVGLLIEEGVIKPPPPKIKIFT